MVDFNMRVLASDHVFLPGKGKKQLTLPGKGWKVPYYFNHADSIISIRGELAFLDDVEENWHKAIVQVWALQR